MKMINLVIDLRGAGVKALDVGLLRGVARVVP
jgi:hypothetical protein